MELVCRGLKSIKGRSTKTNYVQVSIILYETVIPDKVEFYFQIKLDFQFIKTYFLLFTETHSIIRHLKNILTSCKRLCNTIS